MLDRGKTLVGDAAPPRGIAPGKNCTSFGPQLKEHSCTLKVERGPRLGMVRPLGPSRLGRFHGQLPSSAEAEYDTRRFSHDSDHHEKQRMINHMEHEPECLAPCGCAAREFSLSNKTKARDAPLCNRVTEGRGCGGEGLETEGAEEGRG